MEKLGMAALGRPSLDEFKATEKHPVILVLDEVRSGLNVGSIFRTADAFALEAIYLCGITAQPPHREILKTALGSTESVAWRYFEHTHEAIEALRADDPQRRIMAIEQTTESVWLHDLTFQRSEKYAFVLGNEVEGVATEILTRCDGAIEIPQFGTKHSLNVAVAAGIVAWEAVSGMRDTP
jgi:23S rRNA (guanosine2251-2'-O)-methyltransferase